MRVCLIVRTSGVCGNARGGIIGVVELGGVQLYCDMGERMHAANGVDVAASFVSSS